MLDKILAIVPEDFDLGFKLTGVDTQRCVSCKDAKETLENQILKPQYSLILVDEDFLLSFDSRFSKKIQGCPMPLIMAIPLKKSFEEKKETKDYFLKMIQSAIGYEIRIQ